MYEKFYGLKARPFSLLPDPEFLFLSRQHIMALTLLKYSLVNRCAFTVITGEVGAGKTTLINQLLSEVGDEFTVGLLNFTDDRVVQLLPWMLRAYGLPFDNMSPVKMYDCFVQFLVDEHEKGRATVLIVDEAQNLAIKALEKLRMFSNVNASDTLLQTILIGQPEFRSTLKRAEFRQLNQRVSTFYRLNALSLSDSGNYIRHRVQVAGGDPNMFSDPAVRKIWEKSGGIPRTINTLCDMSLVYGFANGCIGIDETIVDEMLSDRDEYAVEATALPEDTIGQTNNNQYYTETPLETRAGSESVISKLPSRGELL
jgi:type II secretory pathway predicted ATPase ExeA